MDAMELPQTILDAERDCANLPSVRYEWCVVRGMNYGEYAQQCRAATGGRLTADAVRKSVLQHAADNGLTVQVSEPVLKPEATRSQGRPRKVENPKGGRPRKSDPVTPSESRRRKSGRGGETFSRRLGIKNQAKAIQDAAESFGKRVLEKDFPRTDLVYADSYLSRAESALREAREQVKSIIKTASAEKAGQSDESLTDAAC